MLANDGKLSMEKTFRFHKIRLVESSAQQVANTNLASPSSTKYRVHSMDSIVLHLEDAELQRLKRLTNECEKRIQIAP